MKTYRWKCSNCGRCCTHLVSDTVLGRFGLFLTPTERKQFPPNIIQPMYGVGIKGHSRPRPKYIFAYQMTMNQCPWYMDKVQRCLIYDQRPIACGQFPISGALSGIMLHRECPEIERMIPEGAEIDRHQLEGLDTEFKALRIMTSYFISIYILNVHNVDTSVAWVYPLNKKKWIQPNEKDWLEALGALNERMKVLSKWRTKKDTVPKNMQ